MYYVFPFRATKSTYYINIYNCVYLPILAKQQFLTMINYTLSFNRALKTICHQLSSKTLAIQANFLNIKFMGKSSN